MKEFNITSRLYQVTVEVKATKTIEGEWYILTNFYRNNGVLDSGKKGVGSSPREILCNHLQSWLESDYLDKEAQQSLDYFDKQLEEAARKGKVPVSSLRLASKRSHVREINPKPYALDIQLNGYFVVGSVSKRGDIWYVHINIRRRESYYIVDRFFVSGYNLINLIKNKLAQLTPSEEREVERKCKVAIKRFELQ